MNCVRVSEAFRTLSMVILAGFALQSASVAHAQTTPPADSGAATFKSSCAMCHGADGAGTTIGKRLKAPDLRSKEVQDLSSDELTKVIKGGKNNMPGFGTRLDSGQIQKLVEYVRTFQSSAAPAK